MSESLQAELETWAAALKAYDEEDFQKALDLFARIADSSKILTNMGLIYATLGEHEAAIEHFIEATKLDLYLAVAYFQCGVSNFLLARYELAYKDFEEAFLYLRGNQAINYEQLGLEFRLFSAEVLFNQGLSLIRLGRMEEGLASMEEAKRDKANDEHNVIDDAIQDRGEGYTVFSIPVGALYRPQEKKRARILSYRVCCGGNISSRYLNGEDTTAGSSGVVGPRRVTGPQQLESHSDDAVVESGELTKIRVKLHYDDDVRGMALTPDTPFEEFLDRITHKFGKDIRDLVLKFKDEDGGKVSLQDESDYELAIETAREFAKGRPEGKLQVWCTDV